MDYDAFASGGVELLVLPAESFVTVVHVETGGDGVPEVFARAIEVIIVESSAAQADEADNQAARAAALSSMIRRNLPSERLRDGGRNGTNRVMELGADGIFFGNLAGDPASEFFIKRGEFDHVDCTLTGSDPKRRSVMLFHRHPFQLPRTHFPDGLRDLNPQ